MVQDTHTHECVHGEQFINLEKRVARNEEKIKTVFIETDKLDETLKKLDNTQDRLAIEIAELNNTFTILKWLTSILIALFGGLFVFLVTELIKII
ncbi:MAG: hypothetical protein ACI389_02325 [Methanobrevibacter sp.]|uniref:hypothetical protein n=1 Tax=Methanobrevibacter sp. TaxID=66852 RepID=UPI003F02680C